MLLSSQTNKKKNNKMFNMKILISIRSYNTHQEDIRVIQLKIKIYNIIPPYMNIE